MTVSRMWSSWDYSKRKDEKEDVKDQHDFKWGISGTPPEILSPLKMYFSASRFIWRENLSMSDFSFDGRRSTYGQMEFKNPFQSNTIVVNDPKDLDKVIRLLYYNEKDAIKRLRVAYIYTSEPMLRLATAVANNESLRSLSLYGSSIGSDAMHALTKSLKANRTLRRLRIAQDTSVPAEAWKTLLGSLFNNKVLTSLVLFENRSPPSMLMEFLNHRPTTMADVAIEALATSLRSNNSLTELELGIISEQGLTILVSAMLENYSLLDCRLCVENIGRYMTPTMSKCLIRNRRGWKKKIHKLLLGMSCTRHLSMPSIRLIIDYVY